MGQENRPLVLPAHTAGEPGRGRNPRSQAPAGPEDGRMGPAFRGRARSAKADDPGGNH